MLKNISELAGVTILSKDQQKKVLGGDPIFQVEHCVYDNQSGANFGCQVQPPDQSHQQPTCIYRCENGHWVKYPY